MARTDETIDTLLISTTARFRAFFGSQRIRDWFLAVGLVSVLAFTYRREWYGAFLWDDGLRITSTPFAADPGGFSGAWTSTAAVYYPLPVAAFWLLRAILDLTPLPFHLLNAGLHAASTLLLWKVLRRLGVPGAWFGAALWGLHPLQVASVAWAAQLENILSCFFCILTSLFFLKWLAIRPANDPKQNRRYYGLALSFSALALLSSGFALMLPFLLGLCWWWVDHRWKRENAARLAPFLALSAAAAAWALWARHRNSATLGPYWDGSLLQRLGLAGKAIWLYFSRLFWPHPLSLVYPRWTIDISDPLTFLPLALVALALFALWPGGDARLRSVFFGITFYLLALFPVLGVVNVYFFRYSFVGDHFQYLASIGPLALLAALLTRAFQKLGFPKVVWGIALVSVCGLGFLVRQQTKIFMNADALWQAVKAACPGSFLPYHELGRFPLATREPEKAIALFQKALEIEPRFMEGSINLGEAYLQTGRLQDALREFRKAVEVAPASAGPRFRLGTALLRDGKGEEGLRQLKEAVRLLPASSELHYFLGDAQLRLGRTEEGITQLRKSLQLSPHFARAQSELAYALTQTGRDADALDQLKKVSEQDPDYLVAQNSMGYLLLKTNRLDEADACFRRALKLNTNYFDTYNGLGCVLVRRGEMDKAVARFREALALRPEYPEAHFNLGYVFHQQGRLLEALFHCRKAVRVKPDYTEARLEFADILLASGQVPQAIEQYEQVLAASPKSAQAHYKLGFALQMQGSVSSAIEHYRKAIEFDPKDARAYNNLAWLLATCPDASFRNGQQAVASARRATELTGGKDPHVEDTLAAALAEAGQFPEAIQTLQRAMANVGSGTNAAVREVLEARLKLYEASSPYRDTAFSGR